MSADSELTLADLRFRCVWCGTTTVTRNGTGHYLIHHQRSVLDCDFFPSMCLTLSDTAVAWHVEQDLYEALDAGRVFVAHYGETTKHVLAGLGELDGWDAMP